MKTSMVLLFFVLAQTALGESIAPEAPTNIAIKDWKGVVASGIQTAGCAWLGYKLPDIATHFLEAAASSTDKEGLAGFFLTPLTWGFQSLADTNKTSAHANKIRLALIGATAGLAGSYLFWLQITSSFQINRAKNILAKYLDHEICSQEYQNRADAAAALIRESSLRGKALDDQSIVGTLVFVTEQLQIALDLLEAVLKTEKNHPEKHLLMGLKRKTLNALKVISKNQTLFTIEYGSDYRGSRQTTAQEVTAQAHKNIAKTTNRYFMLEVAKFGWDVFKSPINLAKVASQWITGC